MLQCNNRFLLWHHQRTHKACTGKPVHKSVSSKHLSHANLSASSAKSNVGISVSCTSACVDQISSVFNIQDY